MICPSWRLPLPLACTLPVCAVYQVEVTQWFSFPLFSLSANTIASAEAKTFSPSYFTTTDDDDVDNSNNNEESSRTQSDSNTRPIFWSKRHPSVSSNMPTNVCGEIYVAPYHFHCSHRGHFGRQDKRLFWWLHFLSLLLCHHRLGGWAKERHYIE